MLEQKQKKNSTFIRKFAVTLFLLWIVTGVALAVFIYLFFNTTTVSIDVSDTEQTYQQAYEVVQEYNCYVVSVETSDTYKYYLCVYKNGQSDKIIIFKDTQIKTIYTYHGIDDERITGSYYIN